MKQLHIDFSTRLGKVKPMHAVNNGPVYKHGADQRVTNIDAFREAGIPYVRNHDASFYSTYGGEHTVDVHAIFPNFDADPYDPASYDFACTDEYQRVIDLGGSETFYRLGSKIEHGIKKYGTKAPKDFQKWAVICEHIIRHYTEGWADGFCYKITYWEIWNEPDNGITCWSGTMEEFSTFFHTVLHHLKKCFPHLKIGGPALCTLGEWRREKWEPIFEKITVKPDFISWHQYTDDPKQVIIHAREARRIMDAYGLQEAESILNEWNYVKGWLAEEWIESLKTEKTLKGASFISAFMCTALYESIDMLMYYDARPCAMNGMFPYDVVSERLKGYYPFWMFGQMYRMDAYVPVTTDDADLYLCATVSEDRSGVMLTYYNDKGGEPTKEVTLTWEGFDATTAKIYLLDENNDATLVKTCAVQEELALTLSLYSTVYIEYSK